MQFISFLQCRAARALLNWNQQDLSGESGVHVQTICGFEKQTTTPTKTTLEKLRLTLEGGGVDFLDFDGVRLRQDKIRTYEGTDVRRRLLDEIYNDLKDTGGEILIKGLTERKWSTADGTVFLNNHIDRLKKANITERLLVSDQDQTFVAPRHWYRTIPEKYFSLHTEWIFNNKVATVTWGDIEKLLIIESPNLYISEMKTFNCIWDNVAQPID